MRTDLPTRCPGRNRAGATAQVPTYSAAAPSSTGATTRQARAPHTASSTIPDAAVTTSSGTRLVANRR